MLYGDTVSVLMNAAAGTATHFSDFADGVWYFHVRAVNRAGYGGPTSTREVRIDTAHNTLPGSNVTVDLESDICVMFDSVSAPGTTTVTTSPVSPGPAPGELLVLGGLYFAFSTTAAYQGPISICLPYDPTGLSDAEQQGLVLLHYDDGVWVNVTDSVDMVRHMVCGSVQHLSWFAVAYPPNQPPAVGPLSAPVDPVKVDTPVVASASFTDPGILDTHTALWAWGDGNVTRQRHGGQRLRHGLGDAHLLQPGVYTVTLTVTDDDGASSQRDLRVRRRLRPRRRLRHRRWLDHLSAWRLLADPALTGKATFGFVTKYVKGATLPSGKTEFVFHAAGLNFQSTSYQWLVIAGAKAQYKGSGTINGGGNHGFMLTAIDGQVSGGGSRGQAAHQDLGQDQR